MVNGYWLSSFQPSVRIGEESETRPHALVALSPERCAWSLSRRISTGSMTGGTLCRPPPASCRMPHTSSPFVDYFTKSCILKISISICISAYYIDFIMKAPPVCRFYILK